MAKVFSIRARFKSWQYRKGDRVVVDRGAVMERWQRGRQLMWHFVRKLKTFNGKAFSFPPRRAPHVVATKTIGTFVILQPFTQTNSITMKR